MWIIIFTIFGFLLGLAIGATSAGIALGTEARRTIVDLYQEVAAARTSQRAEAHRRRRVEAELDRLKGVRP